MFFDVFIRLIHENGTFSVEGFSSGEPHEVQTEEEAAVLYDSLQNALGAGSSKLEHFCLFTRKTVNLKDSTFVMQPGTTASFAEIVIPGKILDSCAIITQLIKLT